MWLWSSGKSLTIKEEKPDKNEKEKEKSEKEELDLEMAYRLLCQVGDQFCDLLHQEKDALQEHMVEGIFTFLFENSLLTAICV